MSSAREISIKEIKDEILICLNQMGISVRHIILFGSRARGDFSKYSDYDILIITDNKLSIKEKMEISKKVNLGIAKLLIPSDVIVKSIDEVDYFKHQIGTVVREALKEGIEI
jgi:predicted nucleotidyltransferase